MVEQNQLLGNAKRRMNKAVQVLKEDLGTIRTGRANPSMIEHVELDVYEGTQKLKLDELATIATEDAQTIVIAPFDPSIIDEIEKGLRGANLNMSVVPDEEKIRLGVPSLTAERREEYIALAGKKVEGARIMVRQIRKEAMQGIKEWFEGEEISEDEKYRLEKKVQELTDATMQKMQEIGSNKEKQIRSL